MENFNLKTLGLLGVGVGIGYSISRLSNKPNISTAALTDSDEILRLIRANIRQLEPYRCARDDYSEGILLDANENSLGSPLPNYNQPDQLERYPSPYQFELKEKIATFRGVKSSEIFLGVGSDEAIDILMRVVCNADDAILITPPTYGMYSVSAHINNLQIVSVPLELHKDLDDQDKKHSLYSLHLNPQKIIDAAVNSSTKIIYICSPGNPTSNLVRLDDIQIILDSEYKGLVVVDEAYIDFAEEKSACHLIAKYRRLVVLQTFSKGFGLAGIRLGVCIADPMLIQHLNSVKAPYNISKLASKVGNAAMENLDAFQRKIQRIKNEKLRVVKKLREFEFVSRIFKSDSNFVLFEVPNAYNVYKTMASLGVVIRFRGNLIHLDNCLRATIGSEKENNRMLSLLQFVVKNISADGELDLSVEERSKVENLDYYSLD